MSEKVRRCPVCGRSEREVNSWIKCQAYADIICESHHVGCKYLDRSCSLSVCRWNDKKAQERERRRAEWQNAHYAACRSAKWDGRPTPSIWDTARLFGGWIPEDILQAEREREAREAAGRQPVQPAPPPSPPEKKKTPGEERRDAAFTEFWEAYPKKCHKQEAEVAAKRITLITWPIIMADVRARSKTVQWTEEGGKFIPNAATYLRHKRWEDPLGPVAAEPDKPRQSRAALMSEDVGNGAAGYEEAVANWRPTYKRKSP